MCVFAYHPATLLLLRAGYLAGGGQLQAALLRSDCGCRRRGFASPQSSPREEWAAYWSADWGQLKRSGGVMTDGRVLPWLHAHVRPRATRQSSGDSAARLARDEPWMRPGQDWSSTSGSAVEERRRCTRSRRCSTRPRRLARGTDLGKCVQWISGLCASCLSVSGTHAESTTSSSRYTLKGRFSIGSTLSGEWSVEPLVVGAFAERNQRAHRLVSELADAAGPRVQRESAVDAQSAKGLAVWHLKRVLGCSAWGGLAQTLQRERAHRLILAGAHVPGAVRPGTTYASAFQQANSLLAQAAAVNHLTARASFVPRRGGH